MDKAERDAWEKVARGAAEAAEGWRALDALLPSFFGPVPTGEESCAMHCAKEAERWAAEAKAMLKPCVDGEGRA
jgi:hypothetical protein